MFKSRNIILIFGFCFFVIHPAFGHGPSTPPFACFRSLADFDPTLHTQVYGPREGQKRDEIIITMRDSGFKSAKKLIEQHSSHVRPGSTILEIGPFFNPLAPNFRNKHPLLFWEYDSAAARAIRQNTDYDQSKITLFQVDLNALSKQDDWNLFIEQNRRELANNGAPQELGAVIISSVLNYVDFRQTLRRVIPLMEDGGLLIVANSTNGTKEDYLNNRATYGHEILEFLLTEFPGQLSLLENAHLRSSGHSGFPASNVSVAIKIHKTKDMNRQNIYEKVLDIFMDDWADSRSFSGDKRDWWEMGSRPKYGLESDIQFKAWLARIRDDKGNPRIAEWNLIREEWKQDHIQRMIEAAKTLKTLMHASPEWEAFKESITSKKSQYYLMFERSIFLNALEMKDLSERASYLDSALETLYETLGRN